MIYEIISHNETDILGNAFQWKEIQKYKFNVEITKRNS